MEHVFRETDGGGTPPPPGTHDDAAERVMRAHGVPPAVAAAVCAAGAGLRARTEQTGHEYAAAFDAATAAAVGEAVEGTEDSVTLRALLRAMAPGREYVTVHTHPENTTFSLYDLGILVASPSLHSIVVARPNGGWSMLTKTARAAQVDEFDVQLVYTAARQHLTPYYQQQVASGRMTDDEANRRMLHGILRVIGPNLGLRYDQIGP